MIGVTYIKNVTITVWPETEIIHGKAWTAKQVKFLGNAIQSSVATFNQLVLDQTFNQLLAQPVKNIHTLYVNLQVEFTDIVKTTIYFNIGDIVAKFGGIFASFDAFFGAIGFFFIHSFISNVAMIINRKHWFRTYLELINLYKDILSSNKSDLTTPDQASLADAMALPLDTYQKGELCKKQLEALIVKYKHDQDERVLQKQKEIKEIEEENIYTLIDKLKMIFSLLGIHKMDLQLRKR